jgi:hypothetical protein
VSRQSWVPTRAVASRLWDQHWAWLLWWWELNWIELCFKKGDLMSLHAYFGGTWIWTHGFVLALSLEPCLQPSFTPMMAPNLQGGFMDSILGWPFPCVEALYPYQEQELDAVTAAQNVHWGHFHNLSAPTDLGSFIFPSLAFFLCLRSKPSSYVPLPGSFCPRLTYSLPVTLHMRALMNPLTAFPYSWQQLAPK